MTMVMMMTGPDLTAHPTNTRPWTLGLCPVAHSLPPCSPENGFYTFALVPIALVLPDWKSSGPVPQPNCRTTGQVSFWLLP